jgi:hypothetical protein
MCDQLESQPANVMSPLKEVLFAALTGSKVSPLLRWVMGDRRYTQASLQQQAIEK